MDELVSNVYIEMFNHIADLKQEIQDLQRGWISVEDRLPEVYEVVIIWIPPDERPTMGYRITERAWTEIEGDSTGRGVTHWMPLPDPPEVEDE